MGTRPFVERVPSLGQQQQDTGGYDVKLDYCTFKEDDMDKISELVHLLVSNVDRVFRFSEYLDTDEDVAYTMRLSLNGLDSDIAPDTSSSINDDKVAITNGKAIPEQSNAVATTDDAKNLAASPKKNV